MYYLLYKTLDKNMSVCLSDDVDDIMIFFFIQRSSVLANMV